ncbi:MAG: dihydrofolate reductase [Bacteroidota bacterium]
MKFGSFLFLTLLSTSTVMSQNTKHMEPSNVTNKEKDNFQYLADQFADLKIMRYKVDGFESLSLNQKALVYYLAEASLAGKDIVYDQNYKHNLLVVRSLEQIYKNYKGDRTTKEFSEFTVYLKRVWFSSGIHHHNSTEKFLPSFSKEYFSQLVKNSPNLKLPLIKGESVDNFIARITPIMFDANLDGKRIELDADKDLITNSAVNFYEGLTQKEVEDFYAKQKIENDPRPISYGLNSKLIKENGKVVEKTWKLNGMYGQSIEQIVYWLKKANTVAESETQKQAINKLIEYYTTGSLKAWDEFNVLWVKDTESLVDFTNGFIEVYGDPMGMKATYEAIVNFKDVEATKRTIIISDNAQWFENNSPVNTSFKKKTVKGVSAKVITVAMLGGDCYPTTPIGINLPNANWIRKEYGSKSVTIDNIVYSYDKASEASGMLEEFAYNEEEIKLVKEHGSLAGNLTTDMHECLGHGSGQLNPGVTAESLKNYHSTIEESRADLFALYYLMDNKMIDLGLIPSLDVAKAEYCAYLRNGLLTQLTRIELGKNIEQAHMRDRQLISKWVLEKGAKNKVVEIVEKNGKHYVVVNDYAALRVLFGQLLAEIQRITSEGDYDAAKAMVETYGVKVDPKIHKEIKERYAKLNLAPYGGFINPKYTLVEKDGKVIDVTVEYPEDFVKQNMEYSEKYSFLPVVN